MLQTLPKICAYPCIKEFRWSSPVTEVQCLLTPDILYFPTTLPVFTISHHHPFPNSCALFKKYYFYELSEKFIEFIFILFASVISLGSPRSPSLPHPLTSCPFYFNTSYGICWCYLCTHGFDTILEQGQHTWALTLKGN